MNTFLKSLLVMFDELLDIELDVTFPNSLNSQQLKISEALDDDYVKMLDLEPLDNNAKVDLVDEAITYLKTVNLLNYNSLPLVQRAKLEIDKVGNDLDFLALSIKAYFNNDSDVVPLKVSLKRLDDLKKSRRS